MNDAQMPERICIWDNSFEEGGSLLPRGWTTSYPAGHPAEYVRSDLCASGQQVRVLREAIRKGACMVVKKKDGTYRVGGNGYSRFEDALEDATIDALTPAPEAAQTEEWDVCSCGPCPLHPAAPAPGITEAIAECERIANEAKGYNLPQMAMGAKACAEALRTLANGENDK